MVHDDLLEQIRQPLLDRVDRRLAAILALSIGVHLAIAIIAWLGDPPVDRPWLEDEPQYVFTDEMIQDLPMPALALPPEPGAGAAAPAPAAPAPATSKGRSKSRSRIPGPPPAIDPTALINDLIGDGPSFREEARRVGKDLDEQLDAAKRRIARVGVDGAEERPGIHEGDGPDVDGVDEIAKTGKLPEVAPVRTIIDPPPPGIEYDPSDEIKRNRMRALQRCYQQELLLDPDLHGRVDLEFTIGKNGRVTSARATGLGAVAPCVQRLARLWAFPVELPSAAPFAMTLIFVKH